jgi:hypothetical protein
MMLRTVGTLKWNLNVTHAVYWRFGSWIYLHHQI